MFRFALLPPGVRIATSIFTADLLLDIFLILVEYGSESMPVISHFDSNTPQVVLDCGCIDTLGESVSQIFISANLL